MSVLMGRGDGAAPFGTMDVVLEEDGGYAGGWAGRGDGVGEREMPLCITNRLIVHFGVRDGREMT